MALGGFVLDEQGEEDLLREALQTVRDQGFRMQRAADAGDQPAVLKHAAEVLRELRTSLLSPKNYYQLYMQVLDELRHFESYVEEQQQAGASMRVLYERVQSSGNVLPRLYLLVTVGSVYIKSKEAPARDVLTDLVEMTKGVQYPLRGLFLRHYLSLSVRDKLPDTGSIYEQAGGGTVSDAIDFLLQNLRETNQLWIRLQHQKIGGSRPLAVREKERMELRLLVGTSLVRLSQMEGVTHSVYMEKVLPRLLDDVVLACKDSMAQQYLMDCVIQVFPDEFHLQNLERLLDAAEKLQPNVDVALILTALLERLTKFREAQGSVTNAGQQVEVLAPLVRDDPNELPSPPPATAVEPGKNKTAEIFEAEQQTLAKVVHLVSNDDLDVRFRVFSVARRAFLQSGVFRIRFTLVPLIYQSLALARDLAAHSQEKTQTEGQETQADTEVIEAGGTAKTFVTTPREVLQFVHEMVTALASKQDALSVSCVHLFLQCALVADGCAFEAVAYEFITQAFIVYEDQITLAREQWRALELMVASLRATRNLSGSNYEVLATKTTQYAARLLKKNEQALMILNCAHLFWHPSQQDGKRVRECLQRSLRIADAIKDTTSNQVPLFLEILEAYLYFYEMQTPEVTRNYLVGLLALVKDHLDNMEHGQMRREGEFRYRAIVRYMDALDISDDAVSTSSSSSSR
ncbi:putative vacuolar protein sorting-associated protein 35 [Phytophthora cinnamomi]|uniref:putative vacuolar protein sorting-associated protein 35 n=1 Tax=Phytophthora cinnamomi TaxID=4785 RepID=UPI00355A2D9D|nr:putative vacuolar protein sorting-associated protein 35 [Phytophthora cinnamomi]